MGGPTAPRQLRLVLLALILAVAAGIADATGYLALLMVFTAHVSGDTVAGGSLAAQGNLARAGMRALPIPTFVAGVFVGAVLLELARRAGVRFRLGLILALEAAVLLLIVGLAARRPGGLLPLIVLLAVAMGLQAASLQRIGGFTVRTTYITGMLTNVADEAANLLFWLRDGRPAVSDQAREGLLPGLPGHPALKRGLLLLSVWSLYAGGAVAGGVFEQRWQLRALLVAAGLLLAAILADVVLGAEEP